MRRKEKRKLKLLRGETKIGIRQIQNEFFSKTQHP